MKNDSFLFPFEMFGDKMFDGNKDGKLTGFETICRDAYHLEQAEKFEKSKKKND
ncbi:MAG: hypothetical protein ACI4IQ_04620 [Eubacterium sp.]